MQCLDDGVADSFGCACDQRATASEPEIKAHGVISRYAIFPRSRRKANRKSDGLAGVRVLGGRVDLPRLDGSGARVGPSLVFHDRLHREAPHDGFTVLLISIEVRGDWFGKRQLGHGNSPDLYGEATMPNPPTLENAL